MTDHISNHQSAAEVFAALWDESGDEIPDVFAFVDSLNDCTLQQRAEVVFEDQRRRWGLGRPLDVEEYLRRLPDLAARDSIKLELITEELGYLHQHGQPVDAEAFANRFPELKDAILADLSDTATVVSNTSTDSQGSTDRSPGVEASTWSTGEVPPDARSASSSPGRIGRYAIQRSLGSGAFGVVHLGYDSVLERAVAIKTPHRDRVASEQDLELFMAEARNVAKLDHPGIAPVHDVIKTDDGLCYVVSHFIEGKDLSEVIRQSRPSHREAANLIAGVAEALHYAHRNGLVHRDIKPANILIDTSGKPYIVDFGLALKEEDFGTGHSFAGTPAYMSPEQACGEGHRVDARSDIYSLGVILYELLTGRRPYYRDESRDVLDQIRQGDMRPPRQLDDSIPRELERICLRALARRLGDRYSTAIDLADDLRSYLTNPALTAARQLVDAAAPASPASVDGTSATVGPAASTDGDLAPRIRIVPKGMRSFDENDSDFFLELLPGPRDRNGLPDVIRFWKQRCDEDDPEKTFTVGLIYGPSGCGKSSLMKAGVIPRLSQKVKTAYVEATATDTEARILHAIRRHLPDRLTDRDLTDVLASIRRDKSLLPPGKILIVIDQFEQWLHTWDLRGDAPLIRALRQCDGGRVQCIVMMRDDFWMAVTRFMMQLEVRLSEGHNSAAVDLFDMRHARKVLEAYGVAYGAIPGRQSELTKGHQAFLDQSVRDLARDGKVISVRLALYAEMVKNRPWLPSTLKEIGGTEGVGVAFLEEAFGDSAPPHRRYFEKAARAVLQVLLPTKGTHIKGQLKSHRELMEASGFSHEPARFEDLLQVLDTGLRLITPADTERRETTSDEANATVEEHRYQLTHDYLVRPVRVWLTRKQRATRRGRAELRLAELAEDWSRKPESRNLPSWWEHLSIRLLTRRTDWSSTQTDMIRKATRYHGIRMFLILAAALALAWTASSIGNDFAAKALHERLLVARIEDVPTIIEEMKDRQRWVIPLLRKTEKELGADDPSRLHVSLALLQTDPRQASYLCRRLVNSRPNELPVLTKALEPHRQACSDHFWKMVKEQAYSNSCLQTAYALARFDPEGSPWDTFSHEVAEDLVSVSPLRLGVWVEGLGPISGRLIKPLSEIYLNADQSHASRRSAARVALEQYAAGDAELLCKIFVASPLEEAVPLMSVLESCGETAIGELRRRFGTQLLPQWPERPRITSWKDPHQQVADKIERAGGLVDDRFAFCSTMPLSELENVVQQMGACGYRPIRIRPYAQGSGINVAAIWTRDQADWAWISNASREEVTKRDREARDQSLLVIDVAGFLTDGSTERFMALWAKPVDQGSDARFYLGLAEHERDALEEVWIEKGLRPVRRHFFTGADGKLRHSLIFGASYDDTEEAIPWHGTEENFQHRAKLFPFPIDVSLTRVARADSDDIYTHAGGIWRRKGKNKEAKLISADTTAEHLAQSRKLSQQSYRPVAVSVTEIERSESMRFYSIWHRPVIDDRTRDAHLNSVALAGAALVRMDRADLVRSELANSRSPDLRTHLIEYMQELECDPSIIVRALETEVDDSIRQALLLSLGEFSLERIPPADRDRLMSRLQAWYTDHPDPGIHGAIEWCLRKWNEVERLSRLNSELAEVSWNGRSNWFHTAHGHSFVVIDMTTQREPFLMGCPETEVEHGWFERLNLKYIRRKFALAAHEVTVRQFRRFLEETPQVTHADIDTIDPNLAKTRVTWYLAARYCNWLSKKDGIPESQWCYIPNPNGEFAEGMSLAKDYLRRTGYRLPSETEWEFCCRAGTISLRPIGMSAQHLDRYAWFSDNSFGTVQEVGLLKPNQLGIFDMLGNVQEWCQERYDGRLDDDRKLVKEDYEDEPIVKNDEMRAARGRSAVWRVPYVRSADKMGEFPHILADTYGFRVARTIEDVRTGLAESTK